MILAGRDGAGGGACQTSAARCLQVPGQPLIDVVSQRFAEPRYARLRADCKRHNKERTEPWSLARHACGGVCTIRARATTEKLILLNWPSVPAGITGRGPASFIQVGFTAIQVGFTARPQGGSLAGSHWAMAAPSPVCEDTPSLRETRTRLVSTVLSSGTPRWPRAVPGECSRTLSAERGPPGRYHNH
jgi:hypothetical protein